LDFILTLRDAELGFVTCERCRKKGLKNKRGEMIQLELSLFEKQEESPSLGEIP